MKENCTILWAEDDQDDIQLILDAARELGMDHLIDFVPNGQEVITKLLRSRLRKALPQLIVLDNNMPILTGAETLNQILQYEELKSIPVVFFTTGKVGAEQHLLENHAEFFLKPASYAEFVETIKAILDLCKQYEYK